MGKQDYLDQSLCKKCFIKHCKPTNKEIRKIVMSEEECQCDCCHKTCLIVEYVED